MAIGIGGMVGLAVAVIIAFQVTIPIIKDTINDTENLSATEETIAGLITLFLVVGLMVGGAKMFGLL
jgi:high-affinity Fe2+/Pb2+ permease